MFVCDLSNQYNSHMPKRLLIILIMIFAPLGAAADTAQSPDATAGLGPQTTSTSSGGSSADAAALQPTTVSNLQSSTADSTGLSAPSNALQAPVTGSDALKVLSNESDGAPQNSADPAGFPWGWLIFTVIIGLMGAAASIVVRDRRRFARATLSQT